MVERTRVRYTTNMSSSALLAEAADAINMIDEGLNALLATGLTPADDRDAVSWITELESLGRRVAAAAVDRRCASRMGIGPRTGPGRRRTAG